MEVDIVVALPLTAVSSQFVIGSFEARFFCAQRAIPATGKNPSRRSAMSDNRLSLAGEKIALDEIFANRPHGSLRSVRNADFSQDVLHVFLDRLVADSQRLGDLFVRQAERELLEHFVLALG